MPDPPEGFADELVEQVTALRDRRIRLDFETVEAARQQGARQLGQEASVVVSNAARMIARTVDVVANDPVTKGAATIGGALGLVGMLLRLLGLI